MIFRVTGILVLVLFFSGCELFNSSYSFNPPNWIKGEWSDSKSINNYHFSSENVTLVSSRISLNFREAFSSRSLGEPKRLMDEYVISVTEAGVNSFYHFMRTSDNSLNYYVSTGGVTYGPLILIRQS